MHTHDPSRPDQTLEIALRRAPGVDVLSLTGSLDIFTAHLLHDAVWNSLCAQPVLTLDLSGVDFIDPRGISTLLAARRWTVRRDADMVVRARAHTRKVLHICRLDEVLRVVGT